MKKFENIPNHVAIILDGNGRWAKKRGLPRSAGHYFGGYNVPKVANYLNELKVKELSIYAFSTENWKRPKDEVDFLMNEPIKHLNKNMQKVVDSNIKILFKGKEDKIPEPMLNCLKDLEKSTRNNTGLILNVCFNYGAYDEILTAIKNMKEITKEELENNLMIKTPVDLMIRTSGEQRLSNFLLWQNAYSELYFTKKHWPSFNKKEVNKAIKAYNKRDRRFGGVSK